MYKVNISTDGCITKADSNTPVATIRNSRDIPTTSQNFRTLNIKLLSGDKGYLCYGGFISGKFEKTCSIPCKWGSSCIRYKKFNCVHNPSFENMGFYVFEEDEFTD